MKFSDLKLNSKILSNLNKNGYEIPTKIQQEVIPLFMKGEDIFGCAQTGTGKTASFALPIIDLLSNEEPNRENGKIKYLVLTPTRELAMQIFENFKKYSYGLNQKFVCLYGGFSKRIQIDIIKMGVDVAICTPGRLLDIINLKKINLSNVKAIVLDEADIMLDMGFINDVKKIISFLPKEHQTLFFSATMPNSIKKLVEQIMKPNYKNITIEPPSTTIDLIEQVAYCVNRKNKKDFLLFLIKKEKVKSSIVFVRTKIEADSLNRSLKNEKINSNSIHGDKEQRQRDRIIKDFKDGKINILVATDVASRGIHVDDISHIFNYDLPDSPETYVHRIGRTGRANKKGVAISLFTGQEKEKVANIQNTTKKIINCQYVNLDTMEFSPMNDEIKNYKKERSNSSKSYKSNSNKKYSKNFSQNNTNGTRNKFNSNNKKFDNKNNSRKFYK